MRVALIHDWITGMRGGEKALEVFCELFPDADLLTLVYLPGTTSAVIERRRVKRSPIQWLPFAGKLYRQYLPLFPIAVEQFDLDRYDLVISTSHCAAKSVVVTGRARHLCYCLTPMRYAWDQFDAYFGPDRVGPLGNRLLRPVLSSLARWDRDTAGRVHRYLAISQYVARRIALYYNRESTLVYPPVDTDFYSPVVTLRQAQGHPGPSTSSGSSRAESRDEQSRAMSERSIDPKPHFLVVSALVPYKRVDLAMMAARQAGVELTVVGSGPERQKLEPLAGDGIRLTGWLEDEEIRELYRTSTATILPGEEDFGIVPVEAQACGRPVVALGRGGALDTVVDGETGVLVADTSVDALAAALQRAATTTWQPQRIRAHAEKFSRQRFMTEIRQIVDETLSAPAGQRW